MTGTVTKAFVDEYWDLKGEITAQLRLTKDSRVVADMTVTGTHSQVSWAASDDEFTDTLYQTLDDFSRKAAAGVREELAAASRSKNEGGPASP